MGLAINLHTEDITNTIYTLAPGTLGVSAALGGLGFPQSNPC